jgi:hypothetical protein
MNSAKLTIDALLEETATRLKGRQREAALDLQIISCKLFHLFSLYGGEGGIRTPDSLATMSDFESGAFNRALPPLRWLTTLFSTAAHLGSALFTLEAGCGLGIRSGNLSAIAA